MFLKGSHLDVNMGINIVHMCGWMIYPFPIIFPKPFCTIKWLMLLYLGDLKEIYYFLIQNFQKKISQQEICCERKWKYFGVFFFQKGFFKMS
jgi:hypothetical protein